ncbi:DUF2062 domain-containing protein [Oceaniglobus roseus]|uniref:DUF2062 domain-containing protein n=1 Tax=Oceaniglobus roseus TaxID=1737570 RepID=UPI001561B709|nr:DUF2062 domain-containing protein [Kandeliimicrobium roseum]
MVFKRRTPRSYLQALAEFFYPRGGWTRAGWYVIHRLRRLPDPAHKIARGIAAGVFTSFTPLFGFHFLVSAGLAWAMRGNILAALLGTFIGNPLTFPIIATVSVELGSRMLGLEHGVPLPSVVSSFSYASLELWTNLKAVFTGRPVQWSNLHGFFSYVFMPYLVGGIPTGILAAVMSYVASRPLISAYQKARIKRLKKKYEKRRAAVEAARHKTTGTGGAGLKHSS